MLRRDPPALDAGIKLYPAQNDKLTHWKAVIKGPDDTVYEGLPFVLNVYFPPTYPSAPPKVTFVTKCWHPNVMLGEGKICMTLLQPDGWSSAYNLHSVLVALRSLMSAPNPDSPLNAEASELLTAIGSASDKSQNTLTTNKLGHSQNMNRKVAEYKQRVVETWKDSGTSGFRTPHAHEAWFPEGGNSVVQDEDAERKQYEGREGDRPAYSASGTAGDGSEILTTHREDGSGDVDGENPARKRTRHN